MSDIIKELAGLKASKSGTSLLTDAEWEAVFEARDRHVKWAEIFNVVGRFKNVSAFQQAAFLARKRLKAGASAGQGAPQ